jgi:hypothetical protein
MGSKARIDEPNSLRMYVFNQTPDNMNRYHGRPMKVVERESLMGYQKGYVETHGKLLCSFCCCHLLLVLLR